MKTFFFSPPSLKSVGPGRMSNMVAKWREIQRKNFLSRWWVQQGGTLKLSSSPSIKVNITVTLHTLKSLALVSGNTQSVCSTGSSREDRHLLSRLSLFVFLFFLSEALPTCVIVWPLSACLLQSAVLCSSPHSSLLPSLPLTLCLPADSYRLASLLFLPSLGLQAKSSSFRTGLPVINLLLLLRQSLSSATSTSTLYLSCNDHFSQRWRCWCVVFFSLGFTYGLASVHFYFIVVRSLLILLLLSLMT